MPIARHGRITEWIGPHAFWGFFVAHPILDRTRDYNKQALNELFSAMDRIEREHGLIAELTDADEAAIAAAEAKLARGERLPELALRDSRASPV
jgi:hypothetical protein